MSIIPEPQSELRSAGALAILGAAERLIGQHGVEGVSMRQITIAARMGNNSAIAYHFGDRDGLLLAVSRWRTPAIEDSRQRLYDEAIASGTLNSPLRMLQIILRPVLIIRADDGSHSHAAFISQMLRSRQGRTIRLATSGALGIVEDVNRRLHGHAPALPLALFEFRLRTASLAFYDAVFERDRMAHDDPARLPMDENEFLAELEAMVLAIVMRPAPSSVDADPVRA
ncbi:MAG: TetR family transcriptional regulator [Novosphingobium sp.]